MKYRIANSSEDLGTHPLRRLRECFATEEAARGVSVEAEGQWHALWPWLQEHGDPAASPAPKGFRPPLIVSVLRVLSCVALGFGLLSLFGPWPMIGQCVVAGVSLWVTFIVIELLARIEYNTRR